MDVTIPIKFKKQPPLIVRIVLLVPLTLFFWMAMFGIGLLIPFIILFGKYTYKDNK